MAWFLLIDGDRVGDLLDQAAAAGEVDALIAASAAIDSERVELAVRATVEGGSVILSNSDTLLIHSETPMMWNVANLTTASFTWSAGQGQTLALAHAALAVAKVRGSGLLVTLTNSNQCGVHEGSIAVDPAFPF